MKILLTGGTGLIGQAVLARLDRAGHELVATGRDIAAAARRFPRARWIFADFARLTDARDWAPLLTGVDAVVNCTGVLQDGARDNSQAVHVAGTGALFDACASAGIRRVIHISAIGAAADGPTAFARDKAEADAHLRSLDLDWVILRPALVLSPTAYGGTAMLRGVAGLPLLTPLIGADNLVQIVSIDDVADTVAQCVAPDGSRRVTFDLAHPEVIGVGALTLAMRAWLGLAPQPVLRVPDVAARGVAALADALGWLGWRSPARSTALAQLRSGVVGDPGPWIAATKIAPQSLEQFFARHQTGVQERWFARLYFVKPLALAALALFWIASGVIGLSGLDAAQAVLTRAGVVPALAAATVIGGGLADIALGIAVCWRGSARAALIGMLALTGLYVAGATWLTPDMWLDPLGPLVKNIPGAVATLFALAILDER